MAALTDVELEKLFSGAPQFFARSQGVGTGPPQPSVAFPWDEELSIRDMTDHTQIDTDAWGCVTAGPRIILRDPMAVASPTARKRPHFNARCRERPNMLSMQGLEKGTLGYQAALEMSVADTHQEEQYGFDSLGSKGHVIVEQRQKIITSGTGLRHLDDAAIMEQLLVNERRYQVDAAAPRLKPLELYNELFHNVLHPPAKVIDPKDPYSLAVQIHALVKVLAAPNAWVDFSRVEWRIRLGQILWGFPLDDEVEDGSSINEGSSNRDRNEERYWLLLQILLACELLIRLDMVTEGEEFGAQNLKNSRIQQFEKEANPSVKWSLLLARAWLENIVVVKTDKSKYGPSTPKGWLWLTSKVHLRHGHMHGSHHTDHTQQKHNETTGYRYSIRGRYTERQAVGLAQFARKLRWPDDTYSLSPAATEALNEAIPLNLNGQELAHDQRQASNFTKERSSTDTYSYSQPVRRRRVDAALHTSGWLSKSYISGLVLPGEALSHSLMSTLIETDPEAMKRLGSMAGLSGGFSYAGKSFWSTACIVGRVLAAGRGSSECMGWVSSDILPQGRDEGWFNISVDNIADDLLKTGRKARLWGKSVVERESGVLGDADPAYVLPADFIIPQESSYFDPPPSNIRIVLKSLELNSSLELKKVPSPVATPFLSLNGGSKTKQVESYPASMVFSMSHDGPEGEREIVVALSNDAYFMTAHPCVASSRIKLLKSPTSPTIQKIDVAGHNGTESSSPAHVTGHPLHKFYPYTTLHLVDLLNRPDASLEDILGKNVPVSRSRSNSTAQRRGQRVLVIDCITGFAPPRSSPDLPPLSRWSSLSSSFGLEQGNSVQGSKVPKMQFPGTPSSPDTNRRPDTAASGESRKVERIDPPSDTINGNGSPMSAESKMRLGTRRRQFGSDMEVLARALCAERGWNALISRKRRGCLACAIREAGAVGWRVVIRVN